MLLLKLIWFDRAFHNLSELTSSDNLSPGHVLVISHMKTLFLIDKEDNQYFIALCITLIPPTLDKKKTTTVARYYVI